MTLEIGTKKRKRKRFYNDMRSNGYATGSLKEEGEAGSSNMDQELSNPQI